MFIEQWLYSQLTNGTNKQECHIKLGWKADWGQTLGFIGPIHKCCEYGAWSSVSYLAQALMFHKLLCKEHLTQQSLWMLLMELHAYFVYLNIIEGDTEKTNIRNFFG